MIPNLSQNIREAMLIKYYELNREAWSSTASYLNYLVKKEVTAIDNWNNMENGVDKNKKFIDITLEAVKDWNRIPIVNDSNMDAAMPPARAAAEAGQADMITALNSHANCNVLRSSPLGQAVTWATAELKDTLKEFLQQTRR